ncbi:MULTISPECIES: MFS transporter [Nocardia]|uniref:MFS transporter n=1 Tax=Nocardia TaxID=1817 RepID=UPI00237DEF35|nr:MULTISPECIES: MFS transporter [Nocardia]MDE1672620.1 MFS transporter [Nocardia gipuzkoensis]
MNGILGNRDFLLLWSGNAISLIGCYCISISYPIIVLAMTGSAIMAGWVAFSFTLATLLLQLPAGKVADSFNRRRILIACQTVGLASVALAALIAILQPPGTAFLWCFTAFIEGSALVLFQICETPVVRDVVPEDHRLKAYSFFEAQQPIAIMVGRAFGATIADIARLLPFLVNALSYLSCMATLLAMRHADQTDSLRCTSHPEQAKTLVIDGVRIVWRHRFLRTTTLIAGLSSMVAQVTIMLILVQARTSGGAAWTVAVVLGAGGIGGLIGAFVAPHLLRLFATTTVYRCALLTWPIVLCPFAFTFDPRVLTVCWCGVGCVGAITGVALTTVRMQVLPDHILGRAMAAMGTWNAGAAALGPLMGGYLISWLGTGQARLLVPIAMCGTALVGLHPATVYNPHHSRNTLAALTKQDTV